MMRPILIALLILAAVLAFPAPLYPDQHREQPQVVSRQAKVSRVLLFEATAYTNSMADTGKKPGDPDYGITFTGTRARQGTVAVDPKVIPLGTRLYVEGYGPAVAEDVGGAVKGNMVDVFLGDEKACREWGRKKVEVRVIE